jgi:N-acetylglucosaminyldiphosphoundecaprenol N-acetyl-beta-D-mannosaminyltransferase
MAHQTIQILGVHIHRVDFSQTLDQIAAWIAASRLTAPLDDARSLARQVCTVNPEFLVEAHQNPAFAATLRQADLRVPDGVGVLWAARLLGAPLAERVTGSDGIYRICETAAQNGWRVFFLGAAPGVAQRTAVTLRKRYPGLLVAGTFSGGPDGGCWPAIAQMLTASSPHILFVAFGHPKQDFWIAQHRHELPCVVALGVGGAFDFVAGVTERAPQWMQRLGLEWLHRLIRQPWRWRRMIKLPIFVLLVLSQWAQQKKR